jgi:hypothetical protein
MNALGELLELLCRAHEDVSHLEAEFRDWDHPRRSHTVVVDRAETGRPAMRWHGGGPWPGVLEHTRHIWFATPDQLRVEVRRADQLVVRLAVRSGSQWWRWDRRAGEDGGRTAGSGASLPPLLNPPVLRPARLLAGLQLNVIGTGDCAGRETIVARGWPRERGPQGLCCRLHFDARHGTLLRREVLQGGQCIQLTEAMSVSYDTGIDPERFVFAPLDGAPPPVA